MKSSIQNARLEVIDVAVNGKEAVEKAKTLKPDVITMDIEMPVMDGITAVREIMAASPTPILMFSSLTHDGRKQRLDALDAGALDFLPKKFEDIARNRDEAVSLLTAASDSNCVYARTFMRRPIAQNQRPTAAATSSTARPCYVRLLALLRRRRISTAKPSDRRCEI